MVQNTSGYYKGPRQTLRKGPQNIADPIFVHGISKKGPEHLVHAVQKLHWLKTSCIFLSGNLLLRESPFHSLNCLKSFDFELLFVCTLKVF